MTRLEIAVACAPMFRGRFDFSDLKEDAKRLAELAFAQADALLEKDADDRAKKEVKK